VDNRLIEKEEAVNYIKLYDANYKVCWNSDLNASVLFFTEEDEQLHSQKNVLSQELPTEAVSRLFFFV
jgi:hypothetical protein